MKKKNLYYHATFKRTNVIKMFILNLFLALCSWFRVPIEIFTRKQFGQRYFLFPLCLFLAAILSIVPFGFAGYGASFFRVIGENFTWYAYLVAFLIFSFKRYIEIKGEPGIYDFKKFSLSPGIIRPWFRNLNILGIKPTGRTIAIYYEPGLFLLAGILLALLKQNIGYLFIVCSIVYGFSWAAQYHLGDQFIMDKIDEQISNEELVNSFVDGLLPEETRGFEVYGNKPKNREFKRKVADSMFEDEPAVDVL